MGQAIDCGPCTFRPCLFCSDPYLKGAEEGKKAVVLVHGIASCCLQSKVETSVSSFIRMATIDSKTGAFLRRHAGRLSPFVHKFRREHSKNWRITWASLKEVSAHLHRFRNVLVLRNTKGRLESRAAIECYGSEVPSTADIEGVQVRPYPGLDGIAYLNPGEAVQIEVWKSVIQALAPDFRLVAPNYDWRRWGDLVFMERYVKEFCGVIEATAKETGQRVSVIAHSMGTSVVTHCLSELGDNWTRKYVSKVVFIGSVVTGCVKGMSAYAHNPASLMSGLGDLLPQRFEDIARKCIVTSPAMLTLMPLRVGESFMLPLDHPVVTTPSFNLTADQTKEYVDNLAANLPAGRVPTAEFYPFVEKVWRKLRPPAVTTHLIYGKNTQTIDQISFKTDDFSDMPEVTKWAAGDGTVTFASQEALAGAWKQESSADVHVHIAPEGINDEHLSIMSSEWLLHLLPSLL